MIGVGYQSRPALVFCYLAEYRTHHFIVNQRQVSNIFHLLVDLAVPVQQTLNIIQLHAICLLHKGAIDSIGNMYLMLSTTGCQYHTGFGDYNYSAD